MKVFVLSVLAVGALLVLGIGGMVWFAAVRKSPGDATATHRGPTPREERAAVDAAYKHKFLVDDASETNFRSRRNFFELSLRNDGMRCGDVTEAAMAKPGIWRVACSTGRSYIFTFDSQGKHIGTQASR